MGQQVTSLRFKLRALSGMLKDEEARAQIDQMETIAQELDNSVDFIAWQLTPPALEGIPLVEAMDNYVRQWRRHHGVSVRFLKHGIDGIALDKDTETALYRVTQEALNNTRKHARAENVQLLLEKQDGALVLVIEDDGVGFSPEKDASPKESMGLTGMSERVTLLGGDLQIDSSPGKGTSVHIRVPV